MHNLWSAIPDTPNHTGLSNTNPATGSRIVKCTEDQLLYKRPNVLDSQIYNGAQTGRSGDISLLKILYTMLPKVHIISVCITMG